MAQKAKNTNATTQRPVAQTSRPSATATGPAGSVSKRNLWQSWMVLPPQTRLRISAAVCAASLVGLFISDGLEYAMPAKEEPATKPSSAPS
ncbi:hypothetical protein GLOTRDRAFT_108961 [Gloeophyllum trabeum ATCC 11539]|uniref:Uncharacterized protein n=1 Tax=Gloeophyllum trabeum (strain ATCC 11539 / FP-39264 / Madison 617) TaxID=670483 RepID=S7QLW9_GLOTA|nr:uncharacterized protein GLOTRDRAFT_108961 [Gloeophyllum trabeum ATCC 11539]EPQ60448.1 hypothetical protein GLOTRDRAFT_108961 [Gloeophyllum trabeum ATCC 11539]